MSNSIVPYGDNRGVVRRYNQVSQMGLASVGAAVLNNIAHKAFNYATSPARKRSRPSFRPTNPTYFNQSSYKIRKGFKRKFRKYYKKYGRRRYRKFKNPRKISRRMSKKIWRRYGVPYKGYKANKMKTGKESLNIIQEWRAPSEELLFYPTQCQSINDAETSMICNGFYRFDAYYVNTPPYYFRWDDATKVIVPEPVTFLMVPIFKYSTLGQAQSVMKIWDISPPKMGNEVIKNLFKEYKFVKMSKIKFSSQIHHYNDKASIGADNGVSVESHGSSSMPIKAYMSYYRLDKFDFQHTSPVYYGTNEYKDSINNVLFNNEDIWKLNGTSITVPSHNQITEAKNCIMLNKDKKWSSMTFKPKFNYIKRRMNISSNNQFYGNSIRIPETLAEKNTWVSVIDTTGYHYTMTYIPGEISSRETTRQQVVCEWDNTKFIDYYPTMPLANARSYDKQYIPYNNRIQDPVVTWRVYYKLTFWGPRLGTVYTLKTVNITQEQGEEPQILSIEENNFNDLNDEDINKIYEEEKELEEIKVSEPLTKSKTI